MVGCSQPTNPHGSPYWAHVGQADSLGTLNHSKIGVGSPPSFESNPQASQAAVSTWFLDWTPLHHTGAVGIRCWGEGFHRADTFSFVSRRNSVAPTTP